MTKRPLTLAIATIGLAAFGACRSTVTGGGQTSSVTGGAGYGGYEGGGGLDSGDLPCDLCGDLLISPIADTIWDTSITLYDFCEDEGNSAYVNLNSCACYSMSGSSPPGCGDSCEASKKASKTADFCNGGPTSSACASCLLDRCQTQIADCQAH